MWVLLSGSKIHMRRDWREKQDGGEPLVGTQHKQSLEVGQWVAIAFTHPCMKMSPHTEVVFWFTSPEYFIYYPLV